MKIITCFLRCFFVLIFLFRNLLRTFRIYMLVNKCGKNLHIFGHVNIIYPRNIEIGNNCCFNHDCYINAYNPIIIGDDVTLSAKVSLISTGINIEDWINGERSHHYSQGIYIGKHVWIGANAQILDGVKIEGPYVVVAAGSVVTKSVNESYCLVAGIPAKITKKYPRVSTEFKL